MPNQSASVGWVLSCASKRCLFNSQSVHILGCRFNPQSGHVLKTTNWCFSSPSICFSLSLLLSKHVLQWVNAALVLAKSRKKKQKNNFSFPGILECCEMSSIIQNWYIIVIKLWQISTQACVSSYAYIRWIQFLSHRNCKSSFKLFNFPDPQLLQL